MTWIRERPLGLVYHDPTLAQPAHTLISSVRGDHATLVDPDGRVIQRWHHDEGIQYARLLPNGHLEMRTLPPEDAGGAEKIGGSSGAIVELDWKSQVVWEYRNPLLHHDWLRLANGNLLVLLWEKLPEGVGEQIRGGHAHADDPDRMWGDVLREITPGGECVREWRSWEHLSFEADRICPLESHKEWTHANSIALMPSGDWLISFRLTSTVAIIDSSTGAFRWRWGAEQLSHQHHASWLENGHVLIFDNGCHRKRGPNFSRVVEVDPETDEIVWSYQHETIVAFYSFMVSGAERMPNGNTFITEGASGRLFEVTPSGETVWEYVSPFGYHSAFGPTPAIFRAHRYAVNDPRFLGAPLDAERHQQLTAAIEAGQKQGGWARKRELTPPE
jgi:hypothetical protein